MANWYNQVFEKAPEKGAPPRMYELPHVIDPGDMDEDIETLLKKNKLDYVFSNNYNFRQFPTDDPGRRNFLNSAKSRQQNPAGIPTKIDSAALQAAFAVEQTVRSAASGVASYLYSYVSPMIDVFRQQNVIRGGSSQKKKQRHNQRKTQRKNYSPKNYSI
jgi:hypothetical protein